VRASIAPSLFVFGPIVERRRCANKADTCRMRRLWSSAKPALTAPA